MPNLVGIGLSQVPTNSMLGGMAYQDPEHASIKNLDLKNLSQINSEIADTAVDVFVYDTRKDSDGGAWRKRTQHTSWYNETLNTSTRGSRKEFPAVAVIVADATTDKVTIYDGDDPDLPMWMVFSAANPRGILGWSSNNYTRFKVAALNGILATTTNDGGHLFKFVEDYVEILYSSTNYPLTTSRTIGGRNEPAAYVGGGGATGTYVVLTYDQNDVAMTVLPNAPIDPSTGLPVPTIAVATQGGVSVITDSGTVYDLTPESQPSYSAIKNFMQVDFTKENHIVLTDRQTSSGFSNVIYLPFYNYDQDLTSTYSKLPDSFSYTWESPVSNDSAQIGEWKPQSTGEEWDYLTTCSDSFALANGDEPAGIGGIVKIGTYPNHLMVNRITKDYNTGWAYGLTQRIFLSDTDDTNKTNGQTDPDRSHNNTALTVYGTITKTPVATGAELVAYGPFSASNYLFQPYNSDLDFGTGDFSVTFWIKTTGQGYAFWRNDTTGSPFWDVWVQATDNIRFRIGFDSINATGNFTQWSQVSFTRSGGTVNIYINGDLNVSTTNTDNITNSDAPIYIGRRFGSTSELTAGYLSLMRISGSAPSAEQVKKMYEDEKVLFQENAKATLYGSSDAVTALAFDDTTNLLHVGTSAGRSEFQGLCRINNTTDAVTTAISASNGLVAEQ